MLIVNQNTENTIILTLSESAYDVTIIGSTTGYTMDLINETSIEVFSGITLTDTSQFTQRYNQFTLTLTGSSSIDYSQAKVYLKDDGFYTYKCYYNADDERELIQQGFMKVINTGETPDTIEYTDGDDDNFFTYQN